jgi:hypothetical protein
MLLMPNGTLVRLGNRSDNGRRTERQESIMRILQAGVLYFVLVFGAGFVLGFIRTLWIVPRLGARMAELLETPIMVVVIVLAARWIVPLNALPPTWPSRLGMGGIAVGLLLVAEFGLVLWLWGLSIT